MLQQKNWWDQYERVDQPTASPAPSQAPGIIYGRPKQPDALELRRMELSERAAERADAAAMRQADAAERRAAADERTSAQTREAEDKAAAFLTRALGSNTSYEKTGVGPRSYVGQIMKNNVPGLLNQLPSAVGNSPERQVADSAQDEFIAATLRQDSGAAIPEDELERQRQIYFPQPGDSEEAIAQKRAARLRAIAGLERSAGRALSPEQRKLLESMRPDMSKALAGETGSAIAAQKQAVTPDNLADLLTGSSGGNYSIERDGLYYTPPGGQRELVRLSDEVANSDAYRAAYLQKFGEEPPLSATITDDSPSEIDKQREGMILDPVIRGIADTVTLGFADELEAGRKTLFDGGTMRDNLASQRRIDKSDERVNPALRIGGQLTGALLPWGRATGGAPGVANRSAWKMAGEGAGLGGVYAFGSAEGSLADRLSAVPAGAVLGGVLGGGLGAIANRMGRKPPSGGGTPPTTPRDIGAAARDIGIDVLPADVGGPVTRGLTATARQMFLSELPIAKKVEDAVEQAANYRGSVAASVARPLDKDDAGELVRKAANIYSKQTGKTGGALYTRAEQLAGDARVTPTRALAELDNQIAELSETPGGSALSDEMKALRASLANGDVSIRGIRSMRTRLREEADFRGLRGKDTDRRLKGVVEAASEDILESLADSGNERAARAFKTADDYWRKRVETIDQVLDPLLGKNSPRSGEQVLGALERMAKRETGDAKRLQRLMTALPEGEAAGVRASVINRLGQAPNAEDGSFSFAEFIKRWDSMSPKAKDTLFPGDARKGLDKLATVARGAKATASYSNTSNTARALGGQALFSTIVGGVGGLPVLAAAAGGQYALGRLLTSKLFVNLLANAPKTDVSTISRGLGNVARRDPALAQDALGLQRFLEQSFAQTPLRAAASTEDKEK